MSNKQSNYKKGIRGEEIFKNILIKRGIDKNLICQAKPQFKNIGKNKVIRLSGDFFKLFDFIHFENGFVNFTQVKTNRADFYSFKKKIIEFVKSHNSSIGIYKVVLIDREKGKIIDEFYLDKTIKQSENILFLKGDIYTGVSI